MMYEEALPAAPLMHLHKGSRLLVVSAMLLVQCLCDPEAGIPQACKQHAIHGPCFQQHAADAACTTTSAGWIKVETLIMLQRYQDRAMDIIGCPCQGAGYPDAVFHHLLGISTYSNSLTKVPTMQALPWCRRVEGRTGWAMCR